MTRSQQFAVCFNWNPNLNLPSYSNRLKLLYIPSLLQVHHHMLLKTKETLKTPLSMSCTDKKRTCFLKTENVSKIFGA